MSRLERATFQDPRSVIRLPKLEDFLYAVTLRFKGNPAGTVNIIIAQVSGTFVTSIEDRDKETGKWKMREGSGQTHPSMLKAQVLALGHVRSEHLRWDVENRGAPAVGIKQTPTPEGAP